MAYDFPECLINRVHYLGTRRVGKNAPVMRKKKFSRKGETRYLTEYNQRQKMSSKIYYKRLTQSAFIHRNFLVLRNDQVASRHL